MPTYAMRSPAPTQSWLFRKPYAATRWRRVIPTFSEGRLSLELATSYWSESAVSVTPTLPICPHSPAFR
jgi:hypothetical protein